MKFGATLIGISPRYYAEIARIVEEVGFESIWIPEHLVFPSQMPPQYPYSENGLPSVTPQTPLYDPWAVLGFLACATKTLRLATNVFIAPLRHPIMTARSLATVDRLSGGRVTLGAGVGWLSTEFDALGVPFRERGARMDELVPLLRKLWSEPTIEHHGRFYDFESVSFEPKPIQNKTGGIPIELGGASPKALERAGKLGDGWIEIGARSHDDLAAKLSVVQQARVDAGRDGLPFEVTSGAWLFEGGAGVTRAQDIGVTRLLASPPLGEKSLSPDEYRNWAESFAARHFG